jgi:polysaccharide biosynthesis protein PelB
MKSVALCIAAAAAVFAPLSESKALVGPVVQPAPEIRATFEHELFELSHAVFLANGNVRDALLVAERAVRARPTDKVWREKAARTAEWAGRSDLALVHWFYLAERGDREAGQSVLRLSRALQEFPLRMRLLEQMIREQQLSQELLVEYLYVAEGLGLPQQAYDLLASGELRGVDPVWQLSQQARLAEMLGRPADAISGWQKRAALKPLAADESLVLASLWYSQGDTGQAWQVFQQGADHASPTAVAFWRTYADLAWALQKTTESVRAADLLISVDAASEADFQRMLELYSGSDPERAYGYARQGWKSFRQPFFWYALADNGLRSGKARELTIFLRSLTLDERKVLERDARSWIAKAQVYRQDGQLTASLNAARIAARLAPSDPDLLSAYLWLLVDLKQVAELRPLVHNWEERLTLLPELREPLAAAMLLLGDTSRALHHYRILAPERQHDPGWLASFATVLEQSGNAEAAWKVRHRAQQLVQLQLDEGLDREDARAALVTQAQLLLHLAPGDGLTARVRQIAGARHDEVAKELIMGWAMATGQTDLARLWYWRHFARSAQRPEWARLGLALEENDRDTMAELVDTKQDQLPYRDAVESAQRAGFHPLAQEHAFNRFQLNRDDHLLDTQVRQLFQPRPGYLQVDLKLQDQSGVGSAESRLTVAQPLTGRYSLMAELTERQFRMLESNVLGTVPGHDSAGSLTLTRRHERGKLSISLGGRDGGLGSFVTGSLEGEWQPWHDLQFSSRLELNGRADETAALSIGGVRDRLRMTAIGGLTPENTISLELAAARFYDQSRRYLGQGQSFGVDLRHQLTRAWPDYGVRLYGGYSRYRADGAITGQTTRLVPDGTTPAASFFVPESFGSLGAGLFFGQTWRASYTRDWKAFGEANIDWNSTTALGFNYSLGLVGPVLGFDQLRLEVTQGSGEFGTTGLTTTIGISYRYFY